MDLNAALFVRILLFQFPALVIECGVLDILYFSRIPTSSREVEVFGYTLKDDVTEDITLDILNDDRGLRNVTWADAGTYLCDTVFSGGGKCTNRVLKIKGYVVSKRLGIKLLDYPTVFSLEAKKNGTMSRTAIVMMSST
ncbi:uncharacterized protein LOC117100648, partial [Anneissia japonica]|uniref:uncharacterized protein LOC117100648 n=1 Tax=Anneissia japonica TaxID=1529436 RepID=UPI001425B28B